MKCHCLTAAGSASVHCSGACATAYRYECHCSCIRLSEFNNRSCLAGLTTASGNGVQDVTLSLMGGLGTAVCLELPASVSGRQGGPLHVPGELLLWHLLPVLLGHGDVAAIAAPPLLLLLLGGYLKAAATCA